MGTCEPGQGRKSAAISSHSQVRRASHLVPVKQRVYSLFHHAKRSKGGSSIRHGGSGQTTITCFQAIMSNYPTDNELPQGESDRPRQYVVVARRYRPQVFEELVGQEHVAQALSNAIAADRVGHAYLFTGARGVGKTSAARILAKAINCEKGPAPTPCNRCDICQSISAGDDVDVLEIDGASNRGIDEIRQLRQNVNVRPSRARFKIYIIDEVHMLTREAFNALLKTLEEPPPHVKFIFCTTEPAKIPVTILSRCQRFDFAGILMPSIVERLRQIVTAEGVEAEPAALEALARRAAGSMRDSQSLLEQLLAFSVGRITLEDVHDLLGTAGDPLMVSLVQHIVDRDAPAALTDFDAALKAGVDATLLIEQLFGYFRDCMCAAAGCTAESFLYVSVAQGEQINRAGKKMGMQTILAVMQILDQALSRMRQSPWARILAELALARICRLEDLDELPALIAELRGGTAPLLPSPASPNLAAPPALAPRAASVPSIGENLGKKNVESAVAPPVDSPLSASGVGALMELNAENMAEAWNKTLSRLSGMVVEHARHFDRLTFSPPNRLVICFKPMYAMAKTFCERPEQVARFEQVLSAETGRQIRIDFTIDSGDLETENVAKSVKTLSQHQLILQIAKHPLIQRTAELFGANPTHVEPPKRE
jgi:DNA polymerase-3 subunit gamma/tau